MSTESRISVGGQGNAGVALDSTIVTQTTGQQAYREAVQVTDPEVAAGRARVPQGSPAASDSALAVKLADSGELVLLLQAILAELRVISQLLQTGLNVSDELEAIRLGAVVRRDGLLGGY